MEEKKKIKERQKGKTMIQMSVGVCNEMAVWVCGDLKYSNSLVGGPRPFSHTLSPGVADAAGRMTSIIEAIKTDIPGRVRRKDPILTIWAKSLLLLLQFNRIKRIKYSSLHIYTAALWLCIHL